MPILSVESCSQRHIQYVKECYYEDCGHSEASQKSPQVSPVEDGGYSPSTDTSGDSLELSVRFARIFSCSLVSVTWRIFLSNILRKIYPGILNQYRWHCIGCNLIVAPWEKFLEFGLI